MYRWRQAQLGERDEMVEVTLQDIPRQQAKRDARVWGFFAALLVATLRVLTKPFFPLMMFSERTMGLEPTTFSLGS